jgi:putative endopeptidase
MLSRRRLLATVMAAPFAAAAPYVFAAGGKPKYGDFGIDLAAMDTAVSPGDDFYRYVNGTWLKTTQIPPDQSRWVAFIELQNLNVERERKLLEEAASATTPGPHKMVGDYYASLMDSAARERLGMTPLRSTLARLAAISSPADLARELAVLCRETPPGQPGGGGRLPASPVACGITVDLNDPSRYLPALGQGGLGMPDRDYYLVDRPDYVAARTAYRTHLGRMFALAGLSNPDERVARVYALEERIARGHRTREASRDVDKRNNKLSPADLAAAAPGLDWATLLAEAGFAGQPILLVSEPEAMTGVAAAARDAPIADWRDYLAYRAIRNFAAVGPKALVDEDFNFEGQTLAGTPQELADWKRACQIVDGTAGQAVGSLYLECYFSPEARRKVVDLTVRIKAAMAVRLREAEWMSAPTKQRALAKLAAVRMEVGGQEPPRSYEGLVIRRDDAAGNLTRAARFEYARNLAKLGKPVDRREWSMNPQLVNAQSNPTLVKVMVPAGILQPPFFDEHADPAVNYGGIGVVIGHELSHQFDDQGAKFDEVGALNNWWKPEDLAQFKAATARLAAQYDAYEPLPGVHINGRLTLGENIADLAGLALAYQAYHASLDGKPAPVLDGFTGDQRFFMSFNQVYRQLQRESYLRQALATDPHSPGEWRAQEVRNVDAWYAAFDVKPGQRAYRDPKDRVRIW